MESVDDSKVKSELQPIVTTVRRLYEARKLVAKQREVEDNSLKLAVLVQRLGQDTIPRRISDVLLQICEALKNNDEELALKMHVQLTTSEWSECSPWLPVLKRIMAVR